MDPNVNLQSRKRQRDKEKLRKELLKQEKQQKKQQEKEQKKQQERKQKKQQEKEQKKQQEKEQKKQQERKQKKQQNRECSALLVKERCKRYHENRKQKKMDAEAANLKLNEGASTSTGSFTVRFRFVLASSKSRCKVTSKTKLG
ncbi:hypothetical protein AVEN_24755-1 [Araneus ventricosus]|uniref:Uncharacterized protein n=1 Tax=Araneus ventricosus TaxID=182803 RepID=A0A4Y2NW43_ARAVE|nr:hypothetical protein AVEN_24755-1 [Araneus ventricosus]